MCNNFLLIYHFVRSFECWSQCFGIILASLLLFSSHHFGNFLSMNPFCLEESFCENKGRRILYFFLLSNFTEKASLFYWDKKNSLLTSLIGYSRNQKYASYNRMTLNHTTIRKLSFFSNWGFKKCNLFCVSHFVFPLPCLGHKRLGESVNVNSCLLWDRL